MEETEDVFVLILVLRPGKQFFSHVETERQKSDVSFVLWLRLCKLSDKRATS